MTLRRLLTVGAVVGACSIPLWSGGPASARAAGTHQTATAASHQDPADWSRSKRFVVASAFVLVCIWAVEGPLGGSVAAQGDGAGEAARPHASLYDLRPAPDAASRATQERLDRGPPPPLR